MTEPSPRPLFVRWLYTNNPFYAISAALMLFAVRASYGTLEIGLINCWIMMGVLAGYTLLLAAVGVLIVRLGKVWDDARSILLLLLLMFLAVSISADDLFVNLTSRRDGLNLLALGFLFSVAVTVGVFRGTQIRFRAMYFIPLVMFLALFFVTPWWCSPELNSRMPGALNWVVFAFPQIAALIGLSLLPAARRGAIGIANNGTPWRWPLFPWTAFGMIGIAVAIRSFALAMTFGQTGPIWADIKGRSGIVFDTIWGPYFLIPFAAVVLLLVLESVLSTGDREKASQSLVFAPVLLPMALPWSNGPAFQTFLGKVTNVIGSPLWLTVLILLALFGWSLWRRIPGAKAGCLAMILLLSIVQPNSIGLSTLSTPQPIPLAIVGAILAITAFKDRSSFDSFVAAALLAYALWLTLPSVGLVQFRFAICYHLMLASCVAFGLLYTDEFARVLRAIGAMLIPMSALIVIAARAAEPVAVPWRLLYVAGLASCCLMCAKQFRDLWYWCASAGTTAVFGYGVLMFGFRSASSVIGRSAMNALSWSAATFLIAFLISAHKANWLPKRFFPGGANGPPPESESITEGLDSLSHLADETESDTGIS